MALVDACRLRTAGADAGGRCERCDVSGRSLRRPGPGYYNDNGSYGVAATIGSGVLVEGNYFENVDDPYHLAEGDSPGGSLVARDNCLVNTGAGQTGGSVASIPYSYTLTPACDVKAVVMAGAGTGKVGAP